MKASQLIYTSWKNGDSPNKGYMVYSKSQDISDSEVDDIKKVMKYVPPLSLSPTPTKEEITADFPYNFAYFKLNSGRVCISLATYLGKDYSNRYGNYLIYALVLDEEDLDQYPVEFFGESFMKNSMTDEELNASSPVPPLPVIDIEEVGNIVTDDVVIEFVNDHQKEVEYFISAVLESRKENVPFYLNDTRENIILWIAIIQKLFSVSVAKHIYFSSYVYEPSRLVEKGLNGSPIEIDLLGVRSDNDEFDYATNTNNSNQIIMDCVNHITTKDIKTLDIACDLTEDYSLGMDTIYEFGDFLDAVGYSKFDYNLVYLYSLFKLNKYKKLNYNQIELKPILEFAYNNINDEQNTEIARNVLNLIKDNIETINLDDVNILMKYLYKYAGYMAYSLHSIFFDLISRLIEEKGIESANELVNQIKSELPVSFDEIKTYFVSPEEQDREKVYLKDNPNINLNIWFSSFILNEFVIDGTVENEVSELLDICLQNLAQEENATDCLEQILKLCKNDVKLESYIINTVYQFANNKSDFATRLGDWLSSSDNDHAQSILNTLMLNGSTMQLAVNIESQYIQKASNKSEAFWDFYDNHKEYFGKGKDLDLSNILDAYLNGDITDKDALEILHKIDISFLVKYSRINDILSTFESEDVNALLSIDTDDLYKMGDIIQTAKIGETFPKIYIVAISKNTLDLVKHNEDFGKLIIRFPDYVSLLDKKDYRSYLNEFLARFLGYVSSEKELVALFNKFSSDTYEKYFYKQYTDDLKIIKKVSEARWMDLLVYTCLAIILNEDEVVEKYTPDFNHYLKKLKPEEFSKVERKTEVKLPPNIDTKFFEKALEKESFTDKVGRFFRR